MDVMTTLPRGRDLTSEDLVALPEDGWRHELVDGALVMTPSPSARHQIAAFELAVRLRSSCPPDLVVMVAPFDVALAADTVLQPDVLVARRADLTGHELPRPPLLAVEVLSPSTRHIDLGLKRSRYEAAGCPSYWVVDPGADDQPASLVAWELLDGAYVEAARVVGEETWQARSPYDVSVVPAALV